MKNYGVDQLPVVQQFPGMGPDAQQVIAVISMAALSREMLKHPEIVDSPLFPYASPKFVVVEPSATLGDVADALSAFTDRRSGDTGSAIVAEKGVCQCVTCGTDISSANQRNVFNVGGGADANCTTRKYSQHGICTLVQAFSKGVICIVS